MEELKRAHTDAAVSFERLADDGWPEDAGWWPIEGPTSPSVKSSQERVQGVSRLSPSQLIKSLMRKAKTD